MANENLTLQIVIEVTDATYTKLNEHISFPTTFYHGGAG